MNRTEYLSLFGEKRGEYGPLLQDMLNLVEMSLVYLNERRILNGKPLTHSLLALYTVCGCMVIVAALSDGAALCLCILMSSTCSVSFC